ncbi:MAG: NTP transferase domain-containing protein [Bacillota bacterium]
MNAIVLAGDKKRKNNDAENTGSYLSDQVDNKALIRIKDKYMIEYVIDVLKGCSSIEKIAVVGPKDKLEPVIGNKVDYIVEGTDSIVDNTLLALEYFKTDKEVLISTSDIPMITVEAVEDFISQARQNNADLYYSVVDKRVNDKRFPGIRRTYARLREGQFTGGNVFMFNPAVTDRCKNFMEKMLEYRKSPAKMAKVLGFGFLIKLVLGMLTIKAVQQKCEKLLGIRGEVIISSYPEIGNDIDKPEDVEYILKFM